MSLQRVCKCSNLQCSEVPLAQKASLFKEFHSKGYNEQQAMIAALVDLRDVKRRYRKGVRYKEASESRRQRTPLYYLWNSLGDRVRVCMGTICDALGVSKVRIQALYKKKAAGRPIEDQRGKHMNRPHRKLKPAQQHGSDDSYNVSQRTSVQHFAEQANTDTSKKQRMTLKELLSYQTSSENNIQCTKGVSICSIDSDLSENVKGSLYSCSGHHAAPSSSMCSGSEVSENVHKGVHSACSVHDVQAGISAEFAPASSEETSEMMMTELLSSAYNQ